MNQEILKKMPEWYRMLMKAIQEYDEDDADRQMDYQFTKKEGTGGVIR